MAQPCGFLNLNKPPGPTSFQMVGMARRLTGIRRVGHGGTLDPAAGGVLVIAIGNATRMTEHLMDGRKEYIAQLRLGVETDTYDAEGRTVAERDTSAVTLTNVEDTLSCFTGPILQVPPMYSALKHEGKPLYASARQGIEIERAPRPVTIYGLTISAWESPLLTLAVTCSRGTYIRSLAHDLGGVLGCGAHLQALTRSRVGPFSIQEAVTPEEFTRAARGGWWEALLHPLDEPVLDMPAAILDADGGRDFQQGRSAPADAPDPARTAPLNDAHCRAYSGEGELLGLMAYDAESRAWMPRKVFSR